MEGDENWNQQGQIYISETVPRAERKMDGRAIWTEALRPIGDSATRKPWSFHLTNCDHWNGDLSTLYKTRKSLQGDSSFKQGKAYKGIHLVFQIPKPCKDVDLQEKHRNGYFKSKKWLLCLKASFMFNIAWHMVGTKYLLNDWTN